ncbi:Acetylglucosaminyltransferase EXT1/exostosin 1 [Handroanthus impetiginosus]|uniref:Acetylglucosaminyltransferase EXT1/exostosin 1 n=1 Tax=Handroanthus impetiginosus TaxID=429701 RepID=A0A2G9GZ38_9LAMI|nr:Acetylglucosaminyltransferase EXT1/exostosin 1 [Handroanthus impetiginosus]
MGNEFRYLCLVETRRLLLLMGVVFGLILFVQYFELPYNNIFSSLFTSGKSQVVLINDFPSRNSSSDPITSRNLTNVSSLNSTDLNVVDGVSSATNVSDGKDGDATNVEGDFDHEDGKSLDDSFNDNVDPEDETPSKDFLKIDGNATIDGVVRNNSFPLDTHKESEYTSNTSALMDHSGVGELDQTSEKNEGNISIQETPPVAKSPPDSPENREESSSIHVDTSSRGKSVHKDAENIRQNHGSPKILKDGHSVPVSDLSVVPISKMNDMLLQSRVTYQAMKPRWSSAVDRELLKAKYLIENAPIIDKDPEFDVNLYRNFSEFKRSYELMERTLKVYIYAEGERPIFHQPPLKGIYASEGWFMKLLKANKRFVAKKPNKAHLFYLPFSSRMLEVALYVPNSHNRTGLIAHLSNYIQMITTKYNFWNRTGGSDHFLVACHDWAPSETRQIMANCIRALCNADVREGFQFGKDVSLPETFVRTPQNPLRQIGGKPPSQRRILAFFAGNMHGYLRPILLNYWQNKDPDMKIFGQIRKAKGQMSYAQYMKSSKYCICAKGFEVNSPRVVEAIFYECVPVIISDNFVPPFFETLNWESFAVFVLEKDIPNLKIILSSISKKRYLKMQQMVKQVQQHFLWHPRPVKYDIFHMILHSTWYNRVFQTRP